MNFLKIGNILLWALTNDNKNYELAINLEDWSGNKRFARYTGFRIGPESDKYRLYFTKMYLGNGGDSLFSHNGLAFSTFDVDNDNREGDDFAERSCARLYKVTQNHCYCALDVEFLNNRNYREDGGMGIVTIRISTAGI